MRPLVSVYFCMCLNGLLVFSTAAQEYPEEGLSLSETTFHIRFLASDELKGRATGEPGNDTAARYIAEQYRAVGLQAPEGFDGYMQPIPFVRTKSAKHGRFVIGPDTLIHGGEMIVLSGGSADFVASIIDVGYGWIDSTSGHDDYSASDIEGKIAIARMGIPGRRFGSSAFSASSTKRKFASAHGARALVEIYNGGFPWSGMLRFLTRTRLSLADGREEGDPLIHLIINDPDSVYAKTEFSDLGPVAITSSGRSIVQVTSNNVIGVVKGRDPELSEEYVVLMAHYDHVGITRGNSEADADSIMNGARDNGMGTVALINAAKALAERPPKRSVLFLAVTGEEVGLLGSRYYVDHPVIPLRQTVFVLNVDTGGVTDTTIVTVVGLERTTAREAIIKGCSQFNLEAIPDPVPEQNLFNRSDNVSFARKGVPAPTFSPGFRDFGPEVMKYYHQPGDEADEDFPFRYLWKFSKAFAHSARMIADMDNTPKWAGDSKP